MVISDFHIICLMSKKPVILQKAGVSIEVVDASVGAYNPEWQVLKSIPVIWYSICPVNRKGLRTYQNEWFDLGCKSGQTFRVAVIESHLQTVIDILSFYLTASPIQEIYVLLRLDGDEKNPAVQCSFSEFMDLLRNGKLLFGVLYHVRNNHYFEPA